MAGILDNKSRILDVILTDIGRDQMNRGEFEVVFASFSDTSVDYQDDGNGVYVDISDRITFEAHSSPNDEITPEIDNQGEFLLTKRLSKDLVVNNGVLFEQTAEGFNKVNAFSRIDDYTNIMTSRYKNIKILRTESSVPDFDVSTETVTIQSNIDSSKTLKTDVEQLKPILIDPRFSGNINTVYLPPVSLNNGTIKPLRAFNRFGKANTLDNTLDELKKKSRGKARIILGSNESFKEHNIISQMFIQKDQSVKKLLVIDGGEYKNDKNEVILQLYHLGFIYKDENGTSKFSRAYSLIFHNAGDEI
tara:strand:- start:74 stop:988 length:915 start_codon:yes stop_codon:yes gene_type:complete